VWKWFIALLIIGLLVLPIGPVEAGSSTDVTITVSGYVCGSPTGLTFIYISDFELGISWTKGVDAANTMLRMAYGRVPDGRDDGYLVYYGVSDNFTDSNIDFSGLTLPPYYRAWSQNAGGLWEEIGSHGEANFMSSSWMLMVFMGFAIALMVINFRRRNILLAVAASMVWLALAVWLFLGSSAPIGLDASWKTILAWVFFIMLFVPLLLQMDTEIKMEGPKGKRWSTWGAEPERKPSAYENYRDQLYGRTRRYRG